jgi:hypothetical protein
VRSDTVGDGTTGVTSSKESGRRIVKAGLTLFQQIGPAHVDRTASSMPTLLRQRMCASRQSDPCLEAMMLQLQCNYYNDPGEGRSNASGRQSKSRYSSNHWREAAKGQFSTGSSIQRTAVLHVTLDTRMCPNQRLWRITDRMILTKLSVQAVRKVPVRSQVASRSETVLWAA